MFHTKKIGVFISHIYGDYQSRLCSGIIKRAEEYGYLVDIFASNDGENLGDYGKGEAFILNIPRPDDYAGIIIAPGTYLVPSLREDIFKLLKDHFSCPIIDVNQHESIYPRIALGNDNPVKDIVLHLANHHHYKNIYYLGCGADADYNRLRQQAFVEGMQDAGLPADHCCCTPDYSREAIEQTLKQILKTNPLPDAIVCYNDQVALSVVSMLKDWNYRIPEQIAITGCDTLEFGQMTSPTLTSVTFPVDELGETAVEQLTRQIRKEAIPPITTVMAIPSYGTSCGCPGSHPVSSYFYARKLDGHIASLEQNLILNMHMAANLQGVDDIDKGMDLLAQFALALPDCKEFYLCLYDDWDRISSHIREITLTVEDEYNTDTVLLKLAIKNGKRLPECTFTKRNILPDYLLGDDSSSYIYTPLFFGDKSFGYLALSFANAKVGYSFFFLSWLMNVNCMLKALCDKKNLGLLVGRLEEIYTKDELTGLLNRQGFKLMSVPAFEKAIHEKNTVCAFMFDLDCLKLINDTYGHAEGNFAIQVLAHALESTIGEHGICSRQGGDEFHVLTFGYREDQASRLISSINKYLDNYNKLHTKGYRIQASSGYCLRIPDHACDLSDMFVEADQNMYNDKRNKEKNILIKGRT